MTIDDLLAAVRALPPELSLVFVKDDGSIRPGLHVTEQKLTRIVSIVRGARPVAPGRYGLQLLDGQARAHLPVGKFAGILAQSVRKVEGLDASPALVEFGHHNAEMQIFQPAKPELTEGEVALRLHPVRAQCKPALEVTRKEAGECGNPDSCRAHRNNNCINSFVAKRFQRPHFAPRRQ